MTGRSNTEQVGYTEDEWLGITSSMAHSRLLRTALHKARFADTHKHREDQLRAARQQAIAVLGAINDALGAGEKVSR